MAGPERLGKAVRYAFTAPIIVWPGFDDPWSIPERLRALVLPERLALYARGIEDEATDVEALIYLHTASLAVPFNERWTGIYLKLAKKYMRWMSGRIPDFMEGYGELDEHELRELRELKRWIRRRQEEAMKEKNRRARGGVVHAKPVKDGGQLSLLDFTG